MALPKLTIGWDLGDRFTQLCAVDVHGQVVATDRLRTTPAALERHFAALPRAVGSSSKSAPTHPG